MEGDLSDGMCRCCASEGSFKDFQVPYQWMGVEEIYGNMLKECFDITLSVAEDSNNGGICEVCITQLRNACNFKRQVLSTEEQFKKKLQEGAFKTEVIKTEISRFEDDDSNLSADDFSSPEYEVPIKVEKVDDKPKKRAAAKASTSKAKKSKASEGEPSAKRFHHELLIKSEIIDDDATKSHIKVEKIVKSEESKLLSENSSSDPPAQEIVTAIVQMPNVKIKKRLSKSAKKSAPTLNKTAKVKLPCITSATGLSKKIKDQNSVTEKNKHYANLEVVLANSNATPIRNHNGFNYVCCFCTAQFKDPAELKTHTLQAHDCSDERRAFMKKQCTHYYLLKLDITLLKCKECDENIDTIEGLLYHLQNEHKKLIYTDVKNQIIPFKFDGEELKCVICSLVFNKFKVLLEHMHTHYRNYVCEVCGYGCINRSRMYHHKESHKTGSFDCNKCDKVFETREKLRKHMNTFHIFMNMPYKCGICKERFKYGPMKDTHMVTVHGMSPVIRKCLACDKTFTTQKWLRMHTKRFHLMENRFPCTECDKKFFTGPQLKNHMLKHSGQRDFQCDVCLKWFTTKKGLKEHMRIHTTDRQYKCAQCVRGFAKECTWRSHMRTVHGEVVDKAESTT